LIWCNGARSRSIFHWHKSWSSIPMGPVGNQFRTNRWRWCWTTTHSRGLEPRDVRMESSFPSQAFPLKLGPKITKYIDRQHYRWKCIYCTVGRSSSTGHRGMSGSLLPESRDGPHRKQRPLLWAWRSLTWSAPLSPSSRLSHFAGVQGNRIGLKLKIFFVNTLEIWQLVTRKFHNQIWSNENEGEWDPRRVKKSAKLRHQPPHRPSTCPWLMTAKNDTLRWKLWIPWKWTWKDQDELVSLNLPSQEATSKLMTSKPIVGNETAIFQLLSSQWINPMVKRHRCLLKWRTCQCLRLIAATKTSNCVQ